MIAPSPYKLYRPSNGTEGEWFMSRWCHQCEALEEVGTGEPCPILGDALAGLDVEQWRIRRGSPCCIAFRKNGEPAPLDPAAVVRPLL